MSKLLEAVDEFFSRQRRFPDAGVESFCTPKWFVVALLYLFAAVLMAQDPWYGQDLFTYAQGGFVILISFVLVTTISFDWCYLGHSRGGNLVLQFLLILPMAMMLGRLIGAPSERMVVSGGSLLGHVKSAFKSGANLVGLLDLIPNPIKELFASPKAALLFALICMSLTAAKNKMLKVGLVVTTLVFLIAFTLSDAVCPPSLTFVAGVLLMITGIAMQFRDVTPEIIDRNIALRLRNVTDEAERRCSIRILKKVCADGKIAPKTAYEIIRRCYVEQFGVDSETVHNIIAPAILNRLVSEHELLAVSYAQGAGTLSPAPGLYLCDRSWLEVALVPRSVVVGVIALLWWLTPIDLFPDALPVVGAIDDFVVVTLGGGAAWRELVSLRRKNRLLPEA
jgi:Uncharacterized conserved protein